MTVKLFTKDGGFVTQAAVPPFTPVLMPEVILWGSRVFAAPTFLSPAVRSAEILAGEVAYVEVFAYTVPDREAR